MQMNFSIVQYYILCRILTTELLKRKHSPCTPSNSNTTFIHQQWWYHETFSLTGIQFICLKGPWTRKDRKIKKRRSCNYIQNQHYNLHFQKDAPRLLLDGQGGLKWPRRRHSGWSLHIASALVGSRTYLSSSATQIHTELNNKWAHFGQCVQYTAIHPVSKQIVYSYVISALLTLKHDISGNPCIHSLWGIPNWCPAAHQKLLFQQWKNRILLKCQLLYFN